MTIERSVLDRPVPRLAERLACLDCPDCAGTCWSVVELARVPEAVLHPTRTRPS